MDRRVEELLERGVKALERLAEDPEILVETLPPVCPHCEVVNPTISVRESEASGKMSEFVMLATCGSCHRRFLIVPVQVRSFIDTTQVQEFLHEKAELSGIDG